MEPIQRRISTLLFVLVTTACSEQTLPESEIYTLYSTNFPTDFGRSGVATFDLANIPEANGEMCRETADLLQADFERRKIEKIWNPETKMRYWCEKGRFRK